MRVSDLELDSPRPQITLPGTATKNGEEARLPLRSDLAAELGQWLHATGKRAQDRVFRVPAELVKTLKRDLAHAGIPFRDESGRTVDVHALRHTTATLLSRANVPPRVAQQILRHSDIKLTMQVYTDVQKTDEIHAVQALPTLPVREGRGSADDHGV